MPTTDGTVPVKKLNKRLTSCKLEDAFWCGELTFQVDGIISEPRCQIRMESLLNQNQQLLLDLDHSILLSHDW